MLVSERGLPLGRPYVSFLKLIQPVTQIVEEVVDSIMRSPNLHMLPGVLLENLPRKLPAPTLDDLVRNEHIVGNVYLSIIAHSFSEAYLRR